MRLLKRIISVCALTLLSGFLSFGVCAPEQKLFVYTSMKESMINDIKTAFVKKYPSIKLEYQSAGAGKLMAKIAAERESGKILADVLWTSEVPDFYNLKEQGLLLPYIPLEIAAIHNPLPDYDGSFTAVRLGTLGIAYNTRFIKEPPVAWDDLKKPAFKGAFGIANPALSGTAYMSVATLSKTFGWTFFANLRANRAKMGKGSGQVIDDTASGDLVASLAVDYITLDKIKKGATMALAYPPEMLVIPSPIAIFKNSPNIGAAKKFVDFMLSKEGQGIVAAQGTLPVRSDVKSTETLPSVEDAIKRAMPIDYKHFIKEKEENIKKFTEIMQK